VISGVEVAAGVSLTISALTKAAGTERPCSWVCVKEGPQFRLCFDPLLQVDKAQSTLIMCFQAAAVAVGAAAPSQQHQLGPGAVARV